MNIPEAPPGSNLLEEDYRLEKTRTLHTTKQAAPANRRATFKASPRAVLGPMKQTVKVKSKSGDWAVQQTLNFESVTFNDVDPAVFTPPQAVRDLWAKANSAH